MTASQAHTTPGCNRRDGFLGDVPFKHQFASQQSLNPLAGRTSSKPDQATCPAAIPGAKLTASRCQEKEHDMTRPTPRQIKAMADATGVPVVDDVAARIANSIGPAFERFAAVAGTLPFDLE